jgi:hypothetical protein
MTRVSRFQTAGAAAVVLAALLACKQGGANGNQKGVGNQPGGVQLGIGDIAVAPFANYVVFERDDSLAVGWIETGKIEALPVTDPTRLAFSKQRPVVYVGSSKTGEILAVDVTQRSVIWHTAVDVTDTAQLRLEVSPDDAFVVAAGPTSMQVLDGGSGQIRSQRTLSEGPLVDLKILADSKRVVVVEHHDWSGSTPRTPVLVLDLATSQGVKLDVPNCSDRIVVTADGKRAFLAPTTCQRDPVSVIDLDAQNPHYDKNLPGFGPVALSPDGTTAVGFLDRDQIDLSLFDDPSLAPTDSGSKYHLMLLDSSSLKYEFVPVGDALPRFAITPDGNVLLVDSTDIASESARLFDVPSRSFKYISGPPIVLDNFALSSNSAHAYVLGNELDDLDVASAHARGLDPGFLPTNLNISADDKLLFLRKNQNEICIFDLATESCQRRFDVGALQ